MTKVILIFAGTVLLCSLAYSANQVQRDNIDQKVKEMMMNMDKNMNENEQDNQGDMNNSNTVDLMAVMAECNESFRIEMSYIQALNDSGSFPDEIDKTPKCFVRCMLEKTGVASEQGTYDPQLADLFFGGERGGVIMNNVEDLATACGKRDETCKCERAYQFLKCLMEKEIQQYEKAQ